MNDEIKNKILKKYLEEHYHRLFLQRRQAKKNFLTKTIESICTRLSQDKILEQHALGYWAALKEVTNMLGLEKERQRAEDDIYNEINKS